MIYIVQNIVPIGIAMLVGLAIGLAWLKLSGRKVPSAGGIAVAAVAEFWLAAILAGALILAPAQAGPWQMALGSALIVWVGFVLPAFVVTLRATQTSYRTISSVVGHWLIVMLAQAAAMQAIGLTAPPGA
ncbi:hypothetical protein GRI38_09515 [Altererythrobacter aurantiacus]|uniref:DUF1761 domain-containing protein n=1 Tax=Parapontixanthobacter aurantiacus TaxID=1463599 RepID=A0A844ZGJ2_9SPHN|nr:hypothetical protein [Parapontixanthobacter aurantiacus]MXO86266.1 hypothetical protein [Parapontixanthobacter aurantiacus]